MTAMPTQSPLELETQRLRLRAWRDSDLAPFAHLNADPRVMRHFPATLSRSESDAMAARIRNLMAKHAWGEWAIEVKGGAPFIGFVGLNLVNANPLLLDAIPGSAPHIPCIEIGWRLAHGAWGKGYATEAAQAALQFGFTQLAEYPALSEIIAFTSTDNIRSQAVMRRLGMHQDRQGFEHPGLPPGHPLRTHVLYRLSRAQWLAARASPPDISA